MTKALNALVASDFVIKYIPFGCGKREAHYKLTDPFCIFYLRFVDNYDSLPDIFWQQNVTSQRINVWRCKRQVLFPKKRHLFFPKCGKLFSLVCGILFSRIYAAL